MTHAFVGLMVLYRLTEKEARKAKNVAGKIVPMVIADIGGTAVFPTVSGPMFIKEALLWVTDAVEGDQPGQWEAITDA